MSTQESQVQHHGKGRTVLERGNVRKGTMNLTSTKEGFTSPTCREEMPGRIAECRKRGKGILILQGVRRAKRKAMRRTFQIKEGGKKSRHRLPKARKSSRVCDAAREVHS